MKLVKILFFSIIFCIIFQCVAAQMGDVYITVPISGEQCKDDGSIIFSAPDSSKSNVIATYIGDKNPFVNGSRREGDFTVKGGWKGSTFESDDGQFKESGVYAIQLEKYGSTQDFMINCPTELRFACSLTELDVACYNRGDLLYIDIKGLGEKEGNRPDMYSDISFKVNGVNKIWEGLSNLPEASVDKVSADTYLIKAKVGQKVEGVVVKGVDCDHSKYPGSVRSRKCVDKPPCELDVDCNGNEFCSEGSCELLECTGCETIKEHKCVLNCEDNNLCTEDSCVEGVCLNNPMGGCCMADSECTDTLACTEDKCVNNRCENPSVVCPPSEDSCLDGTCVEPSGCSYTTKPECEESPSVFGRMIGWFKGLFS